MRKTQYRLASIKMYTTSDKIMILLNLGIALFSMLTENLYLLILSVGNAIVLAIMQKQK